MNSKSVTTILKRLFYTAIIIQVALFVSLTFKWINVLPESTSISIGVESWTLLITLFSIPGALKLFSVIMEKNNHPENKNITIALYKKAFLVRFGVLFFTATLNIVLYAFSYNQNFMFLTLITFIAYIFSYPSEKYLDEITQNEQSKND